MSFEQLKVQSIYEKNLCVVCKHEKDIPALRVLKKCDDCFDGEIAAVEKKDKEAHLLRRLDSMGIPARYRAYDQKKQPLEIKRDDFLDLAEPGKSVAIQGEVGTGKTNLACQIMIRRGYGLFLVATEINKRIAERVKDEDLLIIDDLTEVDSTKVAVTDALWMLFNHRYSQNKDTIITLSKTYTEVEKIFGDSGPPLVSRFKQAMFSVVLKKKWR